jgi:hypothetical protein
MTFLIVVVDRYRFLARSNPTQPDPQPTSDPDRHTFVVSAESV